MFIGHYGVSLAAKPIGVRAGANIPLWVLIIGAQWLDVVWSILVLAGIEKLRITPGASVLLDLYYMPYSHGLPGAIVLSLLFGLIVALPNSSNRAIPALIATAVAFSHWILDLITHTPDLPLYDDSAKVGFGLGQSIAVDLPLELAVLGLGALVYARMTPFSGARGRHIFWACVIFLAIVEIAWDFGVQPPTPETMAMTTLGSYVVVALLAMGVERAATAPI